MELTAQHETFIEHILDCGNYSDAAERAGYARAYGRSLFHKLREEIQARMADELTLMQVQSIAVVKDTMGEGALKPKQDLRLKAAQDTMDRGGLIKKAQLDVQAEILPAAMILPAKDPVPKADD